MKNIFSWFKYNDWYLVINIILLMIFGLAALYSLQINVVKPNFTFFNRQLIYAVIGLAVFFIVSRVNYKVWSDYYKLLYVIAALLLIVVLFLGVKVRGHSGWLEFFGQTFQPVEFAKTVMIIYLARFFSIHAKHPHLLKDILASGLVGGFLIVLVLIQPDLGSAIVVVAIWLVMVSLLPVKKSFFISIILIALVTATVSWMFLFKDYQKDRILTFVDPGRDPLGSGYNVRQATVAIGSGEFFGRGLALGSQSQLNFLPEQETDFIFAVVGEELGFIGAGVALLLFFSLFFRLYKIAGLTPDNFASFYIYGLITYLVVQTFINMGMNMGIAPVAGIPLPLVSSGGSSLVSVLFSLGIANNIQIRNRHASYLMD